MPANALLSPEDRSGCVRFGIGSYGPFAFLEASEELGVSGVVLLGILFPIAIDGVHLHMPTDLVP
jgi:hypothetical protein